MTRPFLRLLSWLLPCLAVATAPALLHGQTGTGKDDPTHDTTPPVTAAAIHGLLAELDACFARGDVAAYLAAFEPDHPGAHALLQRHLQRLAAVTPRLQRHSTVLTEPRQIGPRTIVRVRHTIATDGGHPFHEDTMLAVRRAVDGHAVPTFSVGIPAKWNCVRNDHFRCPPCNYEIGGVAGWLCVPIRPECSQSLEAASFYLIGTDVACDVSVVIDTEAPSATSVVRLLGDAIAELDTDARIGPVQAWLPPSHEQQPPAALAAVRLEIVLPHDFGGRGGVARLHVVTFGGLQHLLLVRGSAAALREHEGALQELLASYRLMELDLDLALAAARPLQHHTGGSFTDNRYQNVRFGFDLAGPAGWHPQQHSGGSALRVVWTSPDGSRLWLTGYDVPPGHERWNERTADRWLLEVLQRARLEPRDPVDHWSEHAACEAGTRTLVCVPKPVAGAAAAPDAPRERSIHVFLRDELLLIADLQSTNDADAASMETALQTLRRR